MNTNDQYCSPKQSLRVLLVEDDDADARLMTWYSGMLEHYSFELTRSHDVDAAFAELQANDYDLCLLDFWIGRHTSLRLLPYLDLPTNRTATVVVSNISAEEVDTWRILSERVIFLAKVDCSAKTLEGAVDSAIQSKSMAA